MIAMLNTLIAFGAGPGVLEWFGRVEAFEVDPCGNVLFRIEVCGPTGERTFVLYRARPRPDIGVEQIVSD